MGCQLLGSLKVAAVFQAWNCREAQDSPQHSSEHAQLEVPISKGDVSDQDATQKKSYSPYFIQVSENVLTELEDSAAPDTSHCICGRLV